MTLFSGGSRSPAADAKVLGVDLPLMEADRPFVVIPENWDAVRLLVAVSGQWRRNVWTGAPLGLDYAACEAAARGMEMEWPENFERLRIMEAVILAERAKK